jgi:hypothetical protein
MVRVVLIPKAEVALDLKTRNSNTIVLTVDTLLGGALESD